MPSLKARTWRSGVDARGRPGRPPRRARRAGRSAWKLIGRAAHAAAAARARTRAARGRRPSARGHPAVGGARTGPAGSASRTSSPCGGEVAREARAAAGCRSRQSGPATKVPSPCRRAMRPSRSSTSRAWRRVISVTPNSGRAGAGCPGASPGRSRPLADALAQASARSGDSGARGSSRDDLQNLGVLELRRPLDAVDVGTGSGQIRQAVTATRPLIVPGRARPRVNRGPGGAAGGASGAAGRRHRRWDRSTSCVELPSGGARVDRRGGQSHALLEIPRPAPHHQRRRRVHQHDVAAGARLARRGRGG